MQQEFEYCYYHQRSFQIFLAFFEKFLTITVSENVNGSSSSTVSLWSDQPICGTTLFFWVAPTTRFRRWVGVLRYIFLQVFYYENSNTKTHKLKEDECTKATQHTILSYLSGCLSLFSPLKKMGIYRRQEDKESLELHIQSPKSNSKRREFKVILF